MHINFGIMSKQRKKRFLTEAELEEIVLNFESDSCDGDTDSDSSYSNNDGQKNDKIDSVDENTRSLDENTPVIVDFSHGTDILGDLVDDRDDHEISGIELLVDG